ncbi:MAG: glutathione binding-like protein [Myxococcales bacterium]
MRQLEGKDYIAGEYSIADIACYPWIVPHELQHQKLEEYPNLQRWFERIRARAATERAYAQSSVADSSAGSPLDAEARRNLFGRDAR